jgi:hypothetical protein
VDHHFIAEAFMSQIQAEPARATWGEKLPRFDRFVALGVLAALLGGPARPGKCLAQVLAQAPASAPAQPSTPPGELTPSAVADLTMRYRFLERYAKTDDGKPNLPEIVQTKVGVVETIKTKIDNPRGAPESRQIVAQTIYTERTAELSPDGAVTAVVRRYDAHRLTPDLGAKPGDPPTLQGLSVWYQVQPGADPLVMSLSDDPSKIRRMREIEFSIVTRQVFFPALSGVLPTLPSRIGDRWRVPRVAARALLGTRTSTNPVMLATFKELRPAAKGSDLVAIITVTAEATPYQAEIQFSFAPPPPAVDDSQGSTVDARGAITELRSAQVMTTPLPDSDGRLRQTQTRELILARQRDNTAPLVVPDAKPVPTEANSWVAYVDPRRRFHFYHPPSLFDDSPPGADSVVNLVQMRPEGPDVVILQLQHKTGDVEADRRNLDPDFHRKELAEIWRQNQQDVVAGSNGWLPEADWKSAGMKVYRIEAALRAAPGSRDAMSQRRVHLDSYLVLTNRPESFVVNATTLQDPPIEFRKKTEAMIKTFRFGLPEK